LGVIIRLEVPLPPKLPFHKIDGFPEVVLAVVSGFIVWGSYGFPHPTEVAVGCIALGCIGAFVWKSSQH
jgi:hypothetical protein